MCESIQNLKYSNKILIRIYRFLSDQKAVYIENIHSKCYWSNMIRNSREHPAEIGWKIEMKMIVLF